MWCGTAKKIRRLLFMSKGFFKKIMQIWYLNEIILFENRKSKWFTK